MRTALALLAALSSGTAAAAGRYALLVGANQGAAGETALRFAVADAERLADTLRALGGFLPENVVLLEGPDADRVRDALARLNARIRAESSAGAESLLLVFYSGHADALALHLGGSALPWEELRNLTAGSAATARLLVIDACRSGQATRVKGTRLTEPFALPAASEELPEGFAVLSSATAGEAAQESDLLGGSFFTHHFLAALRGVADADGDGRVTLGEAFAYTNDRTVASSAATLSGIQHPTYLYDLKGRTDLVLTRRESVVGLGAVVLPPPGQYLLYSGGPAGALVLEANVAGRARTAWLEPGRYFVQRRLPARYHEATVELAREAKVDLAAVPVRVIEYAQLARKGGPAPTAIAASGWGGIESPLLAGLSPQWAGRLAVSVDTAALTVDAQLGGLAASEDRRRIGTILGGVSAAAGARKVIDVGPFSFSAGLRLGGSYLWQRYRGERIAPARSRWVPFVDTVARVELQLPWGLFGGVDGGLRVNWLRLQTGLRETEARTVVQGLVALGVGRQW